MTAKMVSFNKIFKVVFSSFVIIVLCNLNISGQIPGCTNALACNFNPSATEDDGTCVFSQWYIPSVIAGINPAIFTCSPPPGYVLANQGCVATIVANDPYCVNTDWDNICENAYNICAFGCAEIVDCLDPNACNYNPSGLCDRDLCTYPGCTDPIAYNYNPAAGCDNETCNYFNACGNPIFYGNGQGIDFAGYMDPANWTVDTNGGNGSVVFSATTLNITGNNAGGNALFSEATVISPVAGNISFSWSWVTNDLPQFDPAFVQINGVLTQLTNNAGATSQSGLLTLAVTAGSTIKFYVNATDGCCGAATLTISSFQWPGNCIVGCTNELACNYDPNANQDSGLCIFGPSNDEPGNPTAFNLQDDVTTSVFQNLENACTSSNFNCNGTLMNNDVWFSFVSTGGPLRIIAFSTEFLLTPALALYEDPNAPPISCNNFANVAEGPGGIGSELIFNCRELDAGTTYYLQVGGAFIYNGTVGFATIRVLQSSFTEGCMNPLACNFDPNASCDPGGICTFFGCTNPEACNFDPLASCDDNSCLEEDCLGNCGGSAYIDDCGICREDLRFFNETTFNLPGEYPFTVPEGIHELEFIVYGAEGEFTSEFGIVVAGGRGGMATGKLDVQPGDVFYATVGSKSGFNGGGISTFNGNGGGASDIRTVQGDLSSRILVAAGGGGAYFEFGNERIGGAGGGLIGENGIGGTTGGTQEFGGDFGGDFGIGGSSSGGGGGGGWFGGGSLPGCSGAGGSSYINGVSEGITEENVNTGEGLIIIRSVIYFNPNCVGGCNDPNALNFDPNVDFDNGSCQYLLGCTYPNASNFEPNAGEDNGSCLFESATLCAEDITGDGSVNTADLLALLAAFGSICP